MKQPPTELQSAAVFVAGGPHLKGEGVGIWENWHGAPCRYTTTLSLPSFSAFVLCFAG
jgi:hypothetical protein